MIGLYIAMLSIRIPSSYLLSAALLFALAAPAARQAQASTLLTNGSEVHIRYLGVPRLTVLNGDQGYTILIPPGAQRLVVEFQTSRYANIELLAQVGLDVGFSYKDGKPNGGADVAAFKAKPNNLGVARIEISNGHPQQLEPGVVYIGLRTIQDTADIEGVLTAYIDGGGYGDYYSAVESDFTGGADGWTRNETAGSYPGSVAGGSRGRFRHFDEGGNPGGFIIVNSPPGDYTEQFVAPEKFNVNLLELNDARFKFDVARINGREGYQFYTEINVFTDGGGWKWIGAAPPPLTCPPDLESESGQIINGDADGDGDIERCFNFFEQKILTIWQTYTAPIRVDAWQKIPGGTATFEQTMSNPKRIEVRATMNVGGDGTALDNFRVLAAGNGPVRSVAPTVSGFSGGFDDWSRNYPANSMIPGATLGDASSKLLWTEPLSDRVAALDDDGNPSGNLQLAEAFPNGGPLADAFVASSQFRGDYTALSEPRFEFDYYHSSLSGDAKPVTIRLFGAASVFEWTGAAPIAQWRHQVAPLTAEMWPRLSGEASFEDALANVERVEVAADLSAGFERNSLDNFALLTSDSAAFPQDIFATGEDLNFEGAATEPVETQGVIDVSALGGDLQWAASVEGDIASNIKLSAVEGMTPAQVKVTLDVAGLAPGQYEYQVAFQALGTTLTPAKVSGVVTITDQPYATPAISGGGVVNAATFRAQLAPGALGTIFGSGFNAPTEGVQSSFEGSRTNTLPTSLNGIRVRVYATWGALLAEAPIIFANDTQINFQMPFEVRGLSEVRLAVLNGNIESQQQSVQITPQAPGVFTYGDDWAIAVNDGALNSPDNAATRVKPVTLYVTGQGAVSPELPTGRAATAVPLIFTPAGVHVYIGGVEASVQFAGLAPGLVGVLQINLTPAFQTPKGDQPLIVNIGGFESNTARIAIR